MTVQAVVDLGYRPRPWQTEMHAGLKRFSVLVCHRRAGKTVAAVMTLVDAALRRKKSGARFAYIAPFLKQAKAVAWDYLRHYAVKVPGTKINESELYVEFVNGARIRIYGADNPDALRGIYLDGCVIDEVAQMRKHVWEEIILPALSDRSGWMLAIGTPKGINLFSELYHRARQDPEWFAGCYTVNDTDALAPDEIARMRTEMSEAVFRQELLCDFSASTDDSLITIDLAERAAGRTLHASAYEFAPKVLGVDVARFGGDRSVIFPRQGLAAFRPKVFNGIDNMSLAASVAAAVEKWKPDGLFVDAGRGEGVIDRLRQLGYSPLAVDFGGRPTNPRYANKRAEMWDAMATWLKDGGAIPPMSDLKQDLCTPTYSFANSSGKFALESKDQISSRGMPSPDLADALAITFAFPVAPAGEMRRQASVASDYDPVAVEFNRNNPARYAGRNPYEGI